MTAPRVQFFPEAGCMGKARFDSFKLASDVNRARSRGRSNTRRGVYRCSVCLGWHIGRRSNAPTKKPVLQE